MLLLAFRDQDSFVELLTYTYLTTTITTTIRSIVQRTVLTINSYPLYIRFTTKIANEVIEAYLRQVFCLLPRPFSRLCKMMWDMSNQYIVEDQELVTARMKHLQVRLLSYPINNNSEVLLGANIHRPDALLASQEREESEN